MGLAGGLKGAQSGEGTAIRGTWFEACPLVLGPVRHDRLGVRLLACICNQPVAQSMYCSAFKEARSCLHWMGAAVNMWKQVNIRSAKPELTCSELKVTSKLL